MKLFKLPAILLAVSLLISSGIMASGFENSGIGLKAVGMGGAFRAIADDWTASYYNPAGYANIKDNMIGGNLALVHNRNELTPNYQYPGGNGWDQQGIFNDDLIYNYHEILSNPSFGFASRLPVWGETVFGLSLYQRFDENITWQLYDHNNAYNDSLTIPNDQYRNNLDVVVFQLTAGRLFMEDKLSLGVGLQIQRADLLFNNLIFADNPFYDNLPFSLQTLTNKKITQWNHNDGNGWGFGFNFGAIYKVNEKVNLAFSTNIPLDITLSGTSVLQYYMPRVVTNTSDSIAIANEGQPAQFFLSGKQVTDTADFEAELNLPPSVSGGIALFVNDKFTVAFDAEYTFWSQFKGLFFEYTNHRGIPNSVDTSAIAHNFLTANTSNPVEWDDALKLMAGTSYDISNLFTVLGGLSFDQSPSKGNGQITPQFVDTGNKYGYSFGLLMHFEQWDVGFVTSYIDNPELTVGSLSDLDGDGKFDSFAGDYKAQKYETILSFNYRF